MLKVIARAPQCCRVVTVFLYTFSKLPIIADDNAMFYFILISNTHCTREFCHTSHCSWSVRGGLISLVECARHRALVHCGEAVEQLLRFGIAPFMAAPPRAKGKHTPRERYGVQTRIRYWKKQKRITSVGYTDATTCFAGRPSK